MNGQERLGEIFDEEVIEKRTESRGELYEVYNNREEFGDEILLVRFLQSEEDHEALLEDDVSELENKFYDDETPNPWNIQLFWVYEQGSQPEDELRSKLENDTRFAIRRCVPADLLEDFVAPLQKAQKKLDRISDEFNRHELLQNILDNDLGFLLDDITLEEAKNELKTKTQSDIGGASQRINSQDPPRDFIETTELGEFRPKANLRRLEAEPFTLLYGRNATGKTSLLDGTALGLVGQVRNEQNRVDAYDGLHVRLENHEEPLPTDPTSVNDRVAEWFGYRPYGRQKKYVEFYRVNYLEAGAATRLVDSDPDLDVEQTLRRFLFGEELSRARNLKDRLIDDLESEISERESEITETETQISHLEERRDSLHNIFDEFSSAARRLSPATTTIVEKEQDVTVVDDPEKQQERIQRWHDLAQTFERLESSIAALDEPPRGSTTPQKIENYFQQEINDIDNTETTLNRFQDIKRVQSWFMSIKDGIWMTDIGNLPASTLLLALIMDLNGLGLRDIVHISNIFDDWNELLDEAMNRNSIGSWREATIRELEEKVDELYDQRERLREIEDLEERRRELRLEIRSKTRDYLSMVDEVDYCPACYIEQNKNDILERDEPERQREDESKDPSSLSEEIEELEQAIKLLEEPDWMDIEHAVEREYTDFCGIIDLFRLIDDGIQSTNYAVFGSVGSREISTLVDTLESIPSDSDEIPSEAVVEATIERLDDEMADLSNQIEELEKDNRDVEELIEEHKQRKEELETGLDILEDLWSADGWTHNLDVNGDRKILEETIGGIEEEAPKLDLTENIENEINEAESELEDYKQEIEEHRQNIDRLESAFEGTGGEEDLEELVQEHMTIVSTLFMAFQRPYEFEEVQLNDGGSVSIQRRDDGREVPLSSISSGQRAALALAIFVTNNLAHTTAPPLMLLDEPFAHLDDVNIVSFFNLLIELTHRRERQIIFATASQDIADLLERKAGSSDQFKRVRLPTTSAEIQSN